MANEEKTLKYTFEPGDKVGWSSTFAFEGFGYKDAHGAGPFTIESVRPAIDKTIHHQLVTVKEFRGVYTAAWFQPLTP